MAGLQNKRYKIVFWCLAVIAAIIALRLIALQVVKGSEYLEVSQSRTTASLPLKAPRGEIFDRYGRPLVTNRMGFSVVFQKESIKTEQLSDVIGRVLTVLEQTGDSYIDTLPISKSAPFDYIGNETDAKALWRFFKQADGSSSGAMLDFLIKRYKLEEYDRQQARLVAGVRYEMEKRAFGIASPYTFATDVSSEAVTILKEQRDDFPGVSIIVDPIREYADGTLAAHILGRVDVIYAEEYEKLKEAGYSMTDTIGKDGIEKVLEQYLRGVDGLEMVSISGKGETKLEGREPVPGEYGILTIDASLQKALENSLESNIVSMRNKKDAQNASAGAGVVIDVSSGEILAMANYPSFNLETFNKDYGELAKNPNRPMFNRAIGGVYEPGSTFKVLTALAALEEGVVATDEMILDEGIYREYEKYNYAPVCWIWSDSHLTHGLVNVSDALKVSCNYFFYEVGRRLGIDKLVKYEQAVGLGQSTGIEIEGEVLGTVAGPENRKKNNREWYVGDTLQAAIGQSDNVFTPLQIANYIATIVNGGTLYKAHLVKGVKSYTDSSKNITYEPEILQTTPIKKENYDAIIQGMRDASEGGTAAAVFANYRVSVGAKTGTATISKGAANAVFVAFAPLEKPEIAVAIVVEHGGHGSYAAPIARDIFDEYFKVDPVDDPIADEGVLLR